MAHTNTLINTVFDVAKNAALQAGQFIQNGAGNLDQLHIEQKSINDFVSDIDKGAESIIREQISRAFPEHRILGEEFGTSGKASSSYQWIIDPLDGTTNFLRGIPHYAVSIAVTINEKLAVGVIYDPAKNELFSAISGEGATLNARPIACSKLTSVQGALLATGIPFSGNLLDKADMFSDAMLNLLNEQTSGIRRLGAAALDMAYVAAGRYDGFWEAGLKPWDIAAGALILQEAGGQVSDFSGKGDFLANGNVIASTKGMHGEMSKIVSDAYLDF